jgi:hypothetical protein
MRFQRTVVLRLRGWSHEGPDVGLAGADTPIRATLTADPDELAAQADRCRAACDAVREGPAPAAVLEERIASRVRELQGRRRAKRRAFVVVQHAGSAEIAEPDGAIECGEYRVCHAGLAAEALRDVRAASDPHVSAVLGALALDVEAVVGAREIADAIVLFRPDGRPVYACCDAPARPFPLQAGAGRRIKGTVQQLARSRDLATAAALLTSSFQSDADDLRAFLDAWTGLEVFVRHVFPPYAKSFDLARLAGGGGERQLLVQELCAARTSAGTYPLSAEFGIVALDLCPDEAYADARSFRALQRHRDAVHEKSLDPKKLPIAATRKLLRKYLGLHLARAR